MPFAEVVPFTIKDISFFVMVLTSPWNDTDGREDVLDFAFDITMAQIV